MVLWLFLHPACVDSHNDQRIGKPALQGKTVGVKSFLLVEEEAQGDLITLFQYLKGGNKEDGGVLFTRYHTEKVRCRGYKLHWERFHLSSTEIVSPGMWQNPHPGDFQDATGQDVR